MQRKEITQFLSQCTERKLNPNNDPRIYMAKEITFDYGTENAVRVDYMKFKPLNNTVWGIEKGDFYCYEIKSSVEDFHSKHGHNFIGDFNYYVMSREVFDAVKSEIPFRIGVYIPEGTTLYCIKRAKRTDRTRSVSEMLLMMFRSFARDKRKEKINNE